jgi:hypothetical protein
MSKKLRGGDPKSASPSKPKILIYGLPGVGKTYGCLDFPGVYYIDTEGGADLGHYTDKLRASGAAYMGPDDGACDFPTVLEEIQTLATTDHQYRTLVIDSFSKLFNSQVAATQERMERAGEIDAFGASKKEAIKYTRRMVAWMSRLDMNVILICHQKSEWKDGKEVGVTFDAWDKLAYELHLCLRIAKQGQSRKAFIGKTRLLAFPESEAFDWSYAEFAKRYGKEIMETAAKAAVVATPEQIAEYSRLITFAKQDVREKWDAACPDVATLDRDQMAKRLEWLNKQAAAAATPAN